MRGIYTSVTEIRRRVFREVAKLAYEEKGYAQIEELPFIIVPGKKAVYRDSIFLERAIVSERIRLAMGLSLRPIDMHAPTAKGMAESDIADKYYDPPLVNVISFACNSCPDNVFHITDGCQGCLSHPCGLVCPKGAITMVKGRSVIDQSKCIKCGRCKSECPYGAIIKLERPCAKACGMDAIKLDEQGKATIDQDKCVSCGQCLVSCPFGAISDKGQIYQLIKAIMRGDKVIAIVAPAFYSQFGPDLPPEKLTAAMRRLGFDSVVEVAVGADLCAIEEAKDFLEKVPDKQPFMATSCCPSWSVMAKKLFPSYAHCISMAMTPMVLTARLQKKAHPDARIAFIGPCAAKKLEASRRTVRSDVDFVLTFEELMGMFEAKSIDFKDIPDSELVPLNDGTAAGRGFAVTGGVASAVKGVIEKLEPGREINVVSAEGLRDCRKMLSLAKAGKYNGYLLEGMACPGGCVAGAGTLQPVKAAIGAINKYAARADKKSAIESEYETSLPFLD